MENGIRNENDLAVETFNLNKVYGSIFALRDLNLTIETGTFLSIFGPNGAGKSTLLRILSTLVSPTSGSVKINGYDLKDDVKALQKKIGAIFHDPLIYDDLSAWENLEFYGKIYGVCNLSEKIDLTLKELKLEFRKYDHVRTFSQGMKQRLSIGRAILHEPEILMFDEPYEGLDQEAKEILKEILIKFHKKGRTIIMTTHDLNFGLQLSDEVIFLKEGELTYREKTSNLELETFAEMYKKYTGKI